MNFKKTLFTVLLALGCTGAMAQQTTTETVFNPHWYVRGQVGGQYTLGEVSFGDLLSPNAQVAVGYNFTKLWGARLNINAWQSKGGSELYNTKYTWKYNYVAPTVDATLNLTNLIGGFNAKRLVDVTLFAGLGANIAFNNDEAADVDKQILSNYQTVKPTDQWLNDLWTGSKAYLVGNFGVDVDFNINQRVAIGLELAANTTSDHYNSKHAPNSDWYFNGLVGVKVNLGKSTKQVQKKAIDCPPAETKIVEKIVEKPVEKIVYKEPEVKKVEPLRRDVFFTIRSTQITTEEMKKVDDIANYLKANPTAKVSIYGYADKGTGNATINRGLSQKRAAIVVKTLKEKYGIAADRITSDFKGDTEQPFEEEIKNRVSICIAQ